MNTIKISFEVGIERSGSDMTEEKLKGSVTNMLHVYGRSNGLCIENVKLEKIGGAT